MVNDVPVAPEVPAGPSAETVMEVRPSLLRRISWGAIIAGVVVALVTQIVLSVLGIAIGISTIDPTSGRAGWPDALSTGAGIWWVVSGVLALFAGGWVAGRLAGIPRREEGALHGIITWGATTLLSLYLLTTAVGGLVTGAWALVRSGVINGGAETPSAQMHAPSRMGGAGSMALDVDRLRRDIRAIILLNPREQAGQAGMGPQAEQEIFIAAQRFLDPRPGMMDTGATREAVIVALMNRAGMPRTDAERTIGEWQRIYGPQTGAMVVQGTPSDQNMAALAEQTKKAIVSAAVWSFVAFVLGALSAAAAGVIGSRVKGTRMVSLPGRV